MYVLLIHLLSPGNTVMALPWMNMPSWSYCDSAGFYLRGFFCSLLKAVHVKCCSEFSRVRRMSLWNKQSSGRFQNVLFGLNEGFMFSSKMEPKGVYDFIDSFCKIYS